MANIFQRLLRVFARKELGASTTVIYTGNYERGPSWDIAQELKEGYQQCSVVYACVNKIVTGMKSVPWTLFQRQAGGDREEVENQEHPFWKLWNRPNPGQARTAFSEKLAKYWLVTGNSFIQKIMPGPKELYVYRPDMIRIKPDAQTVDGVSLYRYMNDAKGTEIQPEFMLHLKLFEREDDRYWGLSPIRVGASLIDQDNSAINWNASLLRNRCRPDGLFVFKQGLLPQQRAEYEKWIAKEYQGSGNSGKPMTIEGGDFEYRELSKTPQEMDWVNSSVFNNRRICQLYGVAPELVGDPQNKTYSNQAEARLALYEEVIFPLLDHLKEELNSWLLPDFGPGLELDYNKDAVDVVANKRQVVYSMVGTADWLSINEQRVACGYETIPDVEADVPRALSSSRALMAALSAPEPEEEEEPKPEAEEPQEGEEKPPVPEEETEGEKAWNGKPWQVRSPERKAYAYAQVERIRLNFEQFYAIQLAKHFKGEGKAVSSAMKSGGKSAVNAAVKRHRADMERILFGLYGTVGRYFFDRTRNSIPLPKGLQVEKKDVAVGLQGLRAFFGEQATAKAKAIEATTIDRLGRIMSRGLLAGRSNEDVADELQKAYEESMIPNRSVTIASTEVVEISNFGSIEGAKSTELELYKFWIDQQDSRVRPTHRHVNGGSGIPLDEKFIVGGSPMEYPGDPNGPIDEIVNCRCFLAYDEVA